MYFLLETYRKIEIKIKQTLFVNCCRSYHNCVDDDDLCSKKLKSMSVTFFSFGSNAHSVTTLRQMGCIKLIKKESPG